MTFDENTFNPCDICNEHKCDVCILHMLVEEDLKRGKWEINFDYDWDGNKQYFHYHRDCDFNYSNYLEKGYPYCPNCGTKMEVK